MTDFKTSKEMFDAGYAMQTFSIMSDCLNWKFREESFKTFSVSFVMNKEPNIKLAKIEDVRAVAL